MQSSAYIAPAMSDGVVTFLDVLGWRGIYDRTPNATAKLGTLVDGLRKQGERQRGKVQGDTIVKSISDTIAIFTQCDMSEATKAINTHGELAAWAILYSIEAEIPVRGAITYGSFAIQDNIFIGKAVDEAAAWHEYADWIGVHLTPSAEFVFADTYGNNQWVLYTPPNKSTMPWRPHCVNWTRAWDDREQEITKIKAKFRSLGPLVPEIASKLLNTVNFIESIGSEVGGPPNV